jgi:hypothetical protein
MTRYFLLIVLSICFIGCDHDETLIPNCGDPMGASYEPVYIRLLDNTTNENLLGTANYNINNISSQQTCGGSLAEVTQVKGLITGSTDSVTLLRIIFSMEHNGTLCDSFSIKWNDTDTDNFTVGFRDSIITDSDGCERNFYPQFIRENGAEVTQT